MFWRHIILGANCPIPRLTKCVKMPSLLTRITTAAFILLTVAAVGAGEATAPDFSSYPQTDSFRHFLSGHTNATWHLQRTNLLALSAFPSGDRFALQYFVAENGQESDYRDVYNWAIQASHWKQLSEEDLTNLRSALRELPAASTSPPIERLVIVSFRKGTNWVTRSYDCATLPKAMRQIYEIVGERSETKDKPKRDGF
jgi:hypothetical protein